METLFSQGIIYENYVKKIITNKYQSIWLWNEIPKQILLELNFITNLNQSCDDIGCDILAKKHDNTYEYIQCKNYSTLGIDNIISICDLAGFYNFIAENDIKNSIVYYSGVLSSQIRCRMKKIKYINLPYIKTDDDINPRDYQIEAFNTLDNVNRGILDMPCGTGKTLVSYLLSLNYNNVILLSPLIATTEQLMTHYKHYYSNYNQLISFINIHSQSIRNIEKINLETKNIIGSTFDSCDIVNKLISKLNGSIIIFIDECHNISNNMISDSNNEINKLLIGNYKIIFISATPKDYNNEYQNIFGTVKYKLSWDEAINNKYICQSEFYYPNSDKIIEYIEDIKFDKSIIEKTKLIYKAYFLLESIKSLDIKKCIVYLKTVKESEQFKNILKVLNVYFEFKIAVYEINYNIGKNARNTVLTKFRNNKTKISIILNVHVLDEGIDIPECDSVYITNPNNNPINIIQRISRANRIIKGIEKIAKIMLWGKNYEQLNLIFENTKNIINLKIGNIKNEFINSKENIILNTNIIDNNSKDKNNIIYVNIILDKIKEILNIDKIIIIIDKLNTIWFSLSGLLKLLNYSSYRCEIKSINKIIDKYNISSYSSIIIDSKKINNKINNIQPHTKMINLTGFYFFISKSKKPLAIKLKQKLFSKIITNNII